jgi:hypothetical protein
MADHISRPHQQGCVGDLCQQTASVKTYGRSREKGPMADHVSKDVWHTMSARTRGRPRQQVHME